MFSTWTNSRMPRRHEGGLVLDSNGVAPPHLRRLDELAQLVERIPELQLRYSEGPEHDSSESSTDTESGLELPGLSVNPLHPEPWWTRPLTDWLARQICQYEHLRKRNPDRIAWVLRGREVGRGPDCEPLIADFEAVATLDQQLLDEARTIYKRRFDSGNGPE
jgi:hypothetical protein